MIDVARLTAFSLTVLLVACGAGERGPVTIGEGAALTGEPDPAPADGWQELPPAPLSPRHGATAVWVDGSLVVFGGRDTRPCPPAADCELPQEPPLRDGAQFDPRTGTWTAIAELPVDIEHAETAVAGGTVFVSAISRPGDSWVPWFLSYDAAADAWETLPLPPDADERWVSPLEATGDGIVFVASSHERGRLADLVYDPTARTFRELPADPLGPSYDRDLTSVDGRLILTAIGHPPSADSPPRYRAAMYTDTDGWSELPASEITGHNPEWLAVGGLLINPMPGSADGGQVNGYDRPYPFGGILDPRSGSWSELPDLPEAPTGEGLDIGRVSGDDQLLVSPQGWALLPREERWVHIAPPPGGALSDAAVAVGDGRLHVFGGIHWRDVHDADLAEGEISGRGWVFTPPAAPPSAPTVPPSPSPSPSPAASPDDAAVELVVEPTTVSVGENVSFWLVNRGRVELLTGLMFTVERWDGERWVDVTADESEPLVVFPSVGIALRPGGDLRGSAQSWPSGFHEDPLPPGRYRVTKEPRLETPGEPDRTLIAQVEFEVVPSEQR